MENICAEKKIEQINDSAKLKSEFEDVLTSSSSDSSSSSMSTDSEEEIKKKRRNNFKSNIETYRQIFDKLIDTKTSAKQKSILEVQNSKMLRTSIQVLKAVFHGKVDNFKKKDKKLSIQNEKQITNILNYVSVSKLNRNQLLCVLSKFSEIENGKIFKRYLSYINKLK